MTRGIKAKRERKNGTRRRATSSPSPMISMRFGLPGNGWARTSKRVLNPDVYAQRLAIAKRERRRERNRVSEIAS